MYMVLSWGHGQAIEIRPIINYFACSDVVCRSWIAAMVHKRGGSTAEMGATGRWKCNASRRGCGGIDAAPQSRVRSAKRGYPAKREVMGYPVMPAAPFDSTRRRG
jgi:hypothetical protein